MPLKTVTRRFGISAPRVAVYTQLPWYWQAAFIAITVMIVVGLAWATFLLGQRFAFQPFDPNAATRETTEQALARVRRENETLRTQLAALEQKLRMDEATHATQKDQLKSVTDQNAKLKEELAFFQAIGGSASAVSVQRFTVKADGAPGEYRYRLLVTQSRQRAEHFRGRVELLVKLTDKGGEKTLMLPSQGEKPQPYVLGFKFFQRIDGLFKIPVGATVTRVEVRVFEAGVETPHVTQVATLG